MANNYNSSAGWAQTSGPPGSVSIEGGPSSVFQYGDEEGAANKPQLQAPNPISMNPTPPWEAPTYSAGNSQIYMPTTNPYQAGQIDAGMGLFPPSGPSSIAISPYSGSGGFQTSFKGNSGGADSGDDSVLDQSGTGSLYGGPGGMDYNIDPQYYQPGGAQGNNQMIPGAFSGQPQQPDMSTSTQGIPAYDATYQGYLLGSAPQAVPVYQGGADTGVSNYYYPGDQGYTPNSGDTTGGLFA
jgi:hypothetical protein